MPQSTIYFDQRYSPNLVIESPKNFDVAGAIEGDEVCVKLSTKD